MNELTLPPLFYSFHEIKYWFSILGIATPQAVIDAAANAAAQPVATSLSSVSDTLPDLDQSSLRRGKAKVLSLVNVQSTNIPPKEAVTYAKQTQTIESGPELSTRGRGGGGLDYYTLTCKHYLSY